ncbi:hypothetical protein ACGFIU_13335 [Rhodococcus oryzae]|uniref:hypothetical protein n=1 Tax=Rhodococcus oryzae TaxID=2571143 RepID=UPI00371ABEE3
MGYSAAAVVMCRRGSEVRAAVIAVALSVVVPLSVLLSLGWAQPEVAVVVASAQRVFTTGHLYPPAPVMVDDYNPYLPAMALFGVPRTLLPGSMFGDPRLWFGGFFVACVLAAVIIVRPAGLDRVVASRLGLLIASPLVAIAITTGGVDLPVVGAGVLGFALLASGRNRWAALALAIACATKWTAWPLLPVAIAWHAHRSGLQPAMRMGILTAGLTAVCVIPAAAVDLHGLVTHTLLFPLGLAALPTPAGSSLIGGTLDRLGVGGHLLTLALLTTAGAAIARRLWRRPPTGFAAACSIAAAGFLALFLLAPASRFGYFVLPLTLWAMAALADASDTRLRPTSEHHRAGPAETRQPSLAPG